MELGLRGRTAIVCGASSGMGLAIAEVLAAEGANVAMFARRRDLLEREAERIGALAVRGDLTNPTHLQALVERTIEAFGGLDVLVLNGGGPPRSRAVDVTPESLEAAVDLMLTSSVRLVRLALPHLQPSGHGRIVAITSSSVREPIPNLALSNAVRPGLVGWLKTLAGELGPDGVTVNVISPGYVANTEFFGGRMSIERHDRLVAGTLVGRAGEPDDIAAAVRWLVGPGGGYVTGQVIAVNGGAVLG